MLVSAVLLAHRAASGPLATTNGQQCTCLLQGQGSVLSFASLSGAWLLVFDVSNGFLGHRRLQEERESLSDTGVYKG